MTRLAAGENTKLDVTAPYNCSSSTQQYSSPTACPATSPAALSVGMITSGVRYRIFSYHDYCTQLSRYDIYHDIQTHHSASVLH